MCYKLKTLLMIGVLCVVFAAPGNFGFLENMMAKELQEPEKISEEMAFQLLSYDVDSGRGLAVVSTGLSGIVTGDGVRLRAEPSSSGAILEKMYVGEYVTIRKEDSGWYNVQRLKTGTIGWASQSYIRKLR